MKRILSKENGVTEIFHYDPLTDTTTIETRQDVEKHLDYSKALAKDDSYTRDGVKKDWVHYAHLPDSIILELRVNHGINIFNPDHVKAAFRKVNELYPSLKTANIRHNPKG